MFRKLAKFHKSPKIVLTLRLGKMCRMISLPTLADVAICEPMNGMVKWPDPEQIRQDELVRPFLNATGDARRVIADVHARYYVI